MLTFVLTSLSRETVGSPGVVICLRRAFDRGLKTPLGEAGVADADAPARAATGAPLAASDLIKLKFHKNNDGQYSCPVLYKVFTQHSHIVAIRPTGNVYSYDAVKELNIKAASFYDLLDNSPFKRADIITIQDPSDGSKRELDKFSHVTEKLTAKADKDTGGVNHNDATSRVMAQLGKSKAAPASSSKPADATVAGFKPPEEKKGGAGSSGGGISQPRWLQTTGQAAASFTSTNLTPQTVNEIAKLSDEEVCAWRPHGARVAIV